MSSRSPKRRMPVVRSWLRFSMRMMLVGMLFAAVAFAWVGWRLRKSQRQARAAVVLSGLGAVYAYDFQGPIERATKYPWKLAPTPGRSPYSRRLQQWLGIDFLHNITRVHLETPNRLSDDDIERLWQALGDLPDLVHLEASGPVTRPASIRHLRDAGRLQKLALRWANVADDDLAVLAQMPRLQELNLNETPVTDRALVQIAGVRSLTALELHHTKISDEGLRQIAILPELARLRLSATSVGDEGVSHLSRLKYLCDLDLVHTRITDRAMEDVASLARLERLDLSLTAVTEKGLAHLGRLERLRELRLEAMTNLPDVLAAIPKLPALEELHGALLTGDLSRLAQCPKLRVLNSGFISADAMNQGLKLPETLEEISGLALSDATIEELAMLPNLKVVHAGSRFFGDPEQMAEMQRLQKKLRTLRPGVVIH